MRGLTSVIDSSGHADFLGRLFRRCSLERLGSDAGMLRHGLSGFFMAGPIGMNLEVASHSLHCCSHHGG